MSNSIFIAKNTNYYTQIILKRLVVKKYNLFELVLNLLKKILNIL